MSWSCLVNSGLPSFLTNSSCFCTRWAFYWISWSISAASSSTTLSFVAFLTSVTSLFSLLLKRIFSFSVKIINSKVIKENCNWWSFDTYTWWCCTSFSKTVLWSFRGADWTPTLSDGHCRTLSACEPSGQLFQLLPPCALSVRGSTLWCLSSPAASFALSKCPGQIRLA